MLFNPDHVHQVLVKNQKNYVKGQGYDGLRLMLGQGLVTSDGETWLQDRRLMGPFFTPTAVARYTEMMVEVIQRMLDGWQTAADQGQPLQIDEEMMRLTMSVIGRAMFSIDLGEETGRSGPGPARGLCLYPLPVSAGGLLPISFPLPSHRRFQHNMRVIDDLHRRPALPRDASRAAMTCCPFCSKPRTAKPATGSPNGSCATKSPPCSLPGLRPRPAA